MSSLDCHERGQLVYGAPGAGMSARSGVAHCARRGLDAERLAVELRLNPSRAASSSVTDLLHGWLEVKTPPWAASTHRDAVNRMAEMPPVATARPPWRRLSRSVEVRALHGEIERGVRAPWADAPFVADRERDETLQALEQEIGHAFGAIRAEMQTVDAARPLIDP